MAEVEGRDRQATERRLVQAAAEVFAEAGGAGFGVNAVARRAGCDKQLIYRYFGGVDGLLEALGENIAARLSAALTQALDPPPGSYGAFAGALARGLLAAYEADPLLGRIRGWELAGRADEIAPLIAARGKALAAFVQAARPPVGPPEGIDVAATNALLIGAVEALALSAQTGGTLAGLPVASEAGWARASAALERLVAAAYAEG